MYFDLIVDTCGAQRRTTRAAGFEENNPADILIDDFCVRTKRVVGLQLKACLRWAVARVIKQAGEILTTKITVPSPSPAVTVELN